jgi:AcrR family transcriptional regulator
VAARAAALASSDGLHGMTLAQLAADLGVSKSSVQAAFPTKEAIQLAAVAAASDTFVAAVVVPAQEARPGLARLRALVDHWLRYVEERVFPGGCFMVATLAEFDSKPGPVRDALLANRSGWLGLLEHEASAAQRAGDLPPSPTAELLAFELDALLMAANVDRNLRDDVRSLALARDVIALRLGTAPATTSAEP